MFLEGQIPCLPPPHRCGCQAHLFPVGDSNGEGRQKAYFHESSSDLATSLSFLICRMETPPSRIAVQRGEVRHKAPPSFCGDTSVCVGYTTLPPPAFQGSCLLCCGQRTLIPTMGRLRPREIWPIQGSWKQGLTPTQCLRVCDKLSSLFSTELTSVRGPRAKAAPTAALPTDLSGL